MAARVGATRLIDNESVSHEVTGVSLIQRLAAPEPGWTARADIVVVGSGIAGLTTALKARRAGTVLLVTKTELDAGSTRWAQGGIAAALGPGDSPADHLTDTLVAGAGLCDEEAVRVLVTEGPDLVRELVELGTRFDRDNAGDLALTREGGHLRRRIAHRGDATGAEIERALIAAVKATEGIEIIEHALVIDLLKTADGRACGVTLHVIGAGRRDGVGAALGRAVVLATGGLGQVFASTTNPPVATGDGVALALRAGADVTDMEFVQFHPTVLWLGPGAAGQQPLISEALRGEGAVLIDVLGRRFMVGQHPLAELAPRYVVAQAIVRQLRETGADHVLLDARGVPDLAERFPDHHRVVSRERHRPGDDTDPRGAGRAPREWWRAHRSVRPHQRAWLVRMRRGRVHRRARREPAGIEQPARGVGVRGPDRRRAGRRSLPPAGEPAHRHARRRAAAAVGTSSASRPR